MNRFVRALKSLDLTAVRALLERDLRWVHWAEASGKTGLHYVCGVDASGDDATAGSALDIAQLLLERGAAIDTVHSIPDEGHIFPATPLWYAYARGRNPKLFTYLLQRGANPENCMFAIAWNDDVEAAALFKHYGASVDTPAGESTPFLAAFLWRRFVVARWFLENGANVDHADAEGNTALFYAVKRRYDLDRVEMLLHFGADPSRENRDGLSPRGLAEGLHRRKLLQLLG
jgi:ankyrin repeat protein